MINQDIRWIPRFNNFQRAFLLLREVIDAKQNIINLELIIKEGMI